MLFIKLQLLEINRFCQNAKNWWVGEGVVWLVGLCVCLAGKWVVHWVQWWSDGGFHGQKPKRLMPHHRQLCHRRLKLALIETHGSVEFV